MVSALEELLEFEKQADIEIAKLSLWKQPIRSILSLIYLLNQQVAPPITS